MKLKIGTAAVLACASFAAQADQSVIIVDQGTPRMIYRYSWPSGQLINSFGPNTSCQDTIIAPDGTLYAADQGFSRVRHFDPLTGANLGDAAQGVFGDYFGIAIHPDGNLLVAGAFSNSIAKFNRATGAFMGSFVPAGDHGLTNTRTLFYGFDGDLYVSSINGIYRYNGVTGAYVGKITTPQRPDRITMGPDGLIYASTESDIVWRANPNTFQFLGEFVHGQGLSNSRGLGFGPDGDLYIANSNSNVVNRINGQTGILISTFINSGPIQQCASFRFSENLAGIGGFLRLRHRSFYAPPITTAPVVIREHSTGTIVVNQTVNLDSSGKFALMAPSPAGLYDISIKYGHWLRKSFTVDTAAGSALSLPFTLDNGDIDQDNEVGLGDLGILSESFGTFEGDPGYSVDADLDSDGEVGLVDFGILTAYFGRIGDE